MTTTYVYPGGSGGGAPSTHVARLATDALQVSFTRDVTKFRLNGYAQIKPVKLSTDYYQLLDPYQPARILSAAGSPTSKNFATEHTWPRGTRRPAGVSNVAGWSLAQYATQRESFAFLLDLKDEQEADWNIVAQNSKSAAQQAMTRRTQWAATLLSTAANYPSANTNTATSLAGGLWSAATSSNPYIQQSLLAAAAQISLATNAVVQQGDLQLVVNPEAAIVMAASDEIRNFIKSSYDSKEALQMGLGSLYGGFGLPPLLYGFKVLVEDAVVVTTKKGSNTQTQSRVWPKATAAVISRVGELVDAVTEQSFSTLTVFEKENMTVETKTDTWDRIIEGAVTDDIDMQLTAAAAGYCITSIM